MVLVNWSFCELKTVSKSLFKKKKKKKKKLKSDLLIRDITMPTIVLY